MSWAAVAGAAITGGLGYLSSRNKGSGSSGISSEQKAIESTLSDNLKSASPVGLNLISRGSSDLGKASDFWDIISRGNRADIMALFAPELASSDRMQSAALTSNTSLGGRRMLGAGSPEKNIGLVDNSLMQKLNALFGGKEMAFQNLGNIGAGELGSGASILGTGSGTGLGLLKDLLDNRTLNWQQNRAAGESIAQLMEMLTRMFSGNQSQPLMQNAANTGSPFLG